MPLRTREDYLAALRSLRPNIHKFGRPIEDVTTHPATARVVESHARGIDGAHGEDPEGIFTTVSNLTGERIHRFNSQMSTHEEMIFNARFKRRMYQLTGSCTGGLCAGWHGYNVMWSVTWEMDRDLGTDYHQRLREWGQTFEAKGLVVAGALTDAKGNRKLKPHQQADPDLSLHIKERRQDGVVIRGAKLMICGTAASEEIFLLPGSAHGEADRDYALVCVVPRDIEGLTIVETRHPSDGRDLEEGFDNPCVTGITQAYLMFDDVFVPHERIFMAGEYEYTANILARFTSSYRACIGACVAGQGDVMVGAAALMARANGLPAKVFKDKLTKMELLNETTFALGVGAIALGQPHPSGAWVADSRTGHANKIHVATLPYEVKRLVQEIGGGIVETGCLPSYADLKNEDYGPLIAKYLSTGACGPETRMRIARLIEWLTVGGGIPGCMHGGGSPDGARMVLFALSPLEEYARMAAELAGIEEPPGEPGK